MIFWASFNIPDYKVDLKTLFFSTKLVFDSTWLFTSIIDKVGLLLRSIVSYGVEPKDYLLENSFDIVSDPLNSDYVMSLT